MAGASISVSYVHINMYFLVTGHAHQGQPDPTGDTLEYVQFKNLELMGAFSRATHTGLPSPYVLICSSRCDRCASRDRNDIESGRLCEDTL